MNYKEIVLIRHGRPASENNHRVSSGGFGHWVRNYNRAPLHCDTQPLCQRDFSEYFIMSSALRRARLSAQRYTDKPADEVHPLFNEMEIPRYRLPIRLNAWTWVYLNRAIWMAGRPGPFESFTQARLRMEYAVALLLQRVDEHQRVVLFAHALTNRFLVRKLRKRGWKALETDHRYWGVIKLQLPDGSL